MNQYFILSKSNDKKVEDNSTDGAISLNKCNIYILPKNNLSYYNSNGLFEASLIEWCKVFSNSEKIMLDIGAHTGTYSIALNKCFREVHSFEPQRMPYYTLCGSVALSGITNIYCHNFGLGSESQVGEQSLKIVSVDGGGSGLHNTSGIIAEEKIKIKTLDSLDVGNIGFIKIDVEDNLLACSCYARLPL